MYQPLIAHINRYTSLSEDEIGLLTSRLAVKELKKKDYLLKEGQLCHANHFVMKGILRMYFIQPDGAEQIINFAIENWWLTDLMSLETDQPSGFYIQAVEATTVAIMDKKAAEEIFSLIPSMNVYFRKVLQRAYAATQQNLKFIYGLSGEERYRHFASLQGSFVQRIPQYMVASYLGFTPEFISKIRGKKK